MLRNADDGAHLIVDATPPRRMMSLCSVNARSFAKGYSSSESSPYGSDGRGVRKNSRPAGVYMAINACVPWDCCGAHRADVGEDAREEVQLSLVRPLGGV